MTRKANQNLWDQWRQRLARQRESGLSIAEFCRRENLPRQGFHVWKRKLRPAEAVRRASHRSGRSQQVAKGRAVVASSRRPCRATPPRTMPSPSSNFWQLPVTAAHGSPWIELALADGTILRLPQENLAALIAALRVLRGERLEVPGSESGHA